MVQIDQAQATDITSGVATPVPQMETPQQPLVGGFNEIPEEYLRGDPSVVLQSRLPMSKIVESIETGNPDGLEHFSLGKSSTGEPALIFEGPDGQLQHLKISSAQWLGILETRTVNRDKKSRRLKEEHDLLETQNQLRSSFERSLNEVDDELFEAQLNVMFQTHPQHASDVLVSWMRESVRDDEAAAKISHGVIENQYTKDAERVAAIFDNTIQSYAQRSAMMYEESIKRGDTPVPDLQLRQQGDRRRVQALQQGGTHRPVSGSMQMSPAQVYGTNVVPVIKDWLNMLQQGIPTPSGTVSTYSIPHPSSPDFPFRVEEVVSSLNGVSRSLGWRQGFTQDDMPEIMNAINQHYNVHGEQIRIQQLERDYETLKSSYEELKGTGVMPIAPVEPQPFGTPDPEEVRVGERMRSSEQYSRYKAARKDAKERRDEEVYPYDNDTLGDLYDKLRTLKEEADPESPRVKEEVRGLEAEIDRRTDKGSLDPTEKEGSAGFTEFLDRIQREGLTEEEVLAAYDDPKDPLHDLAVKLVSGTVDDNNKPRLPVGQTRTGY